MGNLFGYLFTLFILSAAMLLPGRLGYVSDHPALNLIAERPSIHMENVGHYLNFNEVERGMHHLNKAIESIRQIEKDSDLSNVQGLELSISELYRVQEELIMDTLDVIQMYKSFAYALINLAKVELEVSEKYAGANQNKKARRALKYAHSHIVNSLHFQKMIHDLNSEQSLIEQQVYHQLDSLVTKEAATPDDLPAKIDHLQKGVDLVIAKY